MVLTHCNDGKKSRVEIN
ncbi:hypothetical protein YPPY90_1052, partial [Yersinia pestis PY-90]